MLVIVYITLLLLCVHETRGSLAKPGCQEICGKITVPYPYGIGPGCYRHKSFEVMCNESSQDLSFLWFVHNDKSPILEISMGSLRVVGKSPANCLDSRET